MKRGFVVAIVIVLILVVLFSLGGFLGGASLSQQTPASSNNNGAVSAVIHFTPSAASGDATKQGSCFTNSIAAPYRADAWRCTVGNAISDPCFAIPGSTSTVLCRPDPTGLTTGTFVMKLTKPLPKAEVPTSTPSNWAWLVQLNNGDVCSPFTGTLPFTADHEVAYFACTSAAGQPGNHVILNDLNNTQSPWTASEAILQNSTSGFPIAITSTTVPVATVWQ